MGREEHIIEISGLIIFFIILTFVFLYIALYGKGIDNEIDSAIFEVRLNDDGTAEITETWMRPYGTFERRIDNPEGERFRHLKVLNASDNYWVRRFSDYYIITMYYHSQEQKEPCKITYRLTGVYKEIKGYTSQFSFDFLGSEFPDRVGSMDIIIYLPESTSAARVDTKGKTEISDNAVRISAVSKKGSFPVTVDVYKNDGSHVTDLSYYFIKWKRYVFWGLGFVIFMLLFCILRFGIAAANKDVYAFIKHKNVWGTRSSYMDAYYLTEDAIDELYFNFENEKEGIQSEYERAIRCAFTCGVTNPMSIIFASLLMMASESEAELKKDEILFCNYSFVERTTNLDECVRAFFNTFQTDEIPDSPGWVSVRISNIIEELEHYDSQTKEQLRLALWETAKTMDVKRFRLSGTAKRLLKSSTFYSSVHVPLRMSDMVRSAEKNSLTPKELFVFLYLDNLNRGMGNTSYSPSGGEYILYDLIYAGLCRRTKEFYDPV